MAGALLVVLASGSTFANTITVNSTSDLAANDGVCTLREAIMSANSNSASGAMVGECVAGAAGADLIVFKIPGAGVKTIAPASILPAITETVTIDGYTQPGAKPNTLAVGNNAVLLIEINGVNGSGSAFLVNSAHNTFKGLVINRFPGASGDVGWGFRLLGAANTIQGCYLGTNPAGNKALPNRGGGVSIEATSQPKAVGSGNNLIGGATVAAHNIIVGGVQGSAIDINGVDAAVFQGGIIGGDGNTVQGNYLGTNAAGTAMLGTSGIQVLTKNNIIGGTTAAARNVMFSNGGIGLGLRESNASGNVIQGNFIGIKATGNATLGGNTAGINLLRAPNNTIGGAVVGAGNVISGNGGGGINADDSDNLTIQGNLIGTNAAGTAAVPNPAGIIISAPINNKIGGATAGARNVISGNTGGGVRLSVFTTSAGNLIQGNYIGTDIAGTAPLGNGSNGIEIGSPTFGGAPMPPTTPNAVTVGGTKSGARNVISDSGADGISLGSPNILVQGNYIGTDAKGTADLGNGQAGIRIESNDDTIGGTAPGAGNVIAFSGKKDRGNTATQGDSGVVIYGVHNAILGNSIFSNLRLGIDLPSFTENAFGVTPNDDCDVDVGPNDQQASNNLQNYPLITGVTLANHSIRIVGTLNSTANTTFRLEFFGSSAPDPSGHGQGHTFLGFTNVKTDASCNATYDVSFSVPSAMSSISATATDPTGNTSEFSNAFSTRLLNISTRMRVLTGEQVLIGGFIIIGGDGKEVLVRGIGPSLGGAGVSGTLQDPTLALQGNSVSVTNDNWKTRDTDGSSQQAQIKATGIPPASGLESAIVQTLSPGGYTAILRGKGDTTGVGLVEVYDLNLSSGSQLANISTRGFVDTADNVMIGGFIVGPAGTGNLKVLLRAIGPSLSSSDIQGALQDPTLDLRDVNGAKVVFNDNWKSREDGSSQQAEIEATTIPPKDNRESAILLTLAPGNYTAIVRGVNDTTGVALVEVYALQ